MRLDLKWKPFLPHQKELFDFDPPPGEIEISAILGGWGSGKTHGAARKAFRIAIENPWREEYGSRRNPLGLILAPTFSVLQNSTIPQLLAVTPKELIKKFRGPPKNDLLMVNGFRWLFYSGQAEVEGLNDVACVWVDEIQKSTFSNNPLFYLNLLARLRSNLPTRKAMIVSGLPESGFVRDYFDLEGPARKTILCPTSANKYIDPAILRTFYESCPGGEERSLLGGEWRNPSGMIYHHFHDDNRVSEGYDPALPTHVGIDIGEHGAALLAQQIQVPIKDITGSVRHAPGLRIVAQVLTEGLSVDALMYKLKTDPEYHLDQRTLFCVDPTIRRDELAAMRKHFPSNRIVVRDRSHDCYEIEAGIRVTQSAFCDALGNRRLQISRSIGNQPYGLFDSLLRYRRNERTGIAIKDDSRDHVLDALRYLACEFLRVDRPQARTIKV